MIAYYQKNSTGKSRFLDKGELEKSIFHAIALITVNDLLNGK